MQLPTLPPNIDEFIIPEQFNALRDSYQPKWVANDTHPFIQTLQTKLSEIEDHIAHDAGRKACHLEVHFDDRNLPNSLPFHGDKDKRATWHDDNSWTNNIGYRNGTPGLVLVANTYHEGEHANQTKGYGYTKDQQIMCSIAKVFYPKESQGPEYRNNYTEVYARIAEANFYLATYHRLSVISPKTTLTDQYYHMLCDACTHLTTKVSREAMRQINQNAIQYLLIPTNRASGLRQAFPDAPSMTRKFQAIAFLQTKAMGLYEQALQDMEVVADALRDVIRDIEKAREDQKKQEKQKATQLFQETLKEVTQRLNIPVISQIVQPFPDIAICLSTPESIESALSPAPNKYNLCVAPVGDKVYAWYDLQPRERPYNPSLQQTNQVNVVATGPEKPNMSVERDDYDIDEYEEEK